MTDLFFQMALSSGSGSGSGFWRTYGDATTWSAGLHGRPVWYTGGIRWLWWAQGNLRAMEDLL